MRKSLFIMCVLLFGFTAVAEEKAEKKLSEKIIGKWKLDIDASKKSLEKSKKTEEEIEEIIEVFSISVFEFDGNNIVVSISEEGIVNKVPYKLISEKDNILKIEVQEDINLFKFIDDDTVELSVNDVVLYLKRQK